MTEILSKAEKQTRKPAAALPYMRKDKPEMDDLFDKEAAVLERAKKFLRALPDVNTDYYKEFVTMTMEYENLLRQARILVRCSDLNVTGLNSDKRDLLDKVNIDELTNIYNRRFLEENLRRYLHFLSRTNGHLSLLMLDLDFFKNFNDTYGHTAGDICLKKVASTLQDSINRAEDFAARYGGEEFVIVLSGTGKEGAVHVAEKILNNIRQLDIPHEQNQPEGRVTISIGITSSQALQVNDPHQYIARADAALYHSKRSGRNRITYYPMDTE